MNNPTLDYYERAAQAATELEAATTENSGLAFGYDIQILRDSFANAKAETVENFPTGCQAQEVGNVYSESWGRGGNFKSIRVFELRFTDDDFVNRAVVYIATGKAVFGRDSRNFPTVESITKGWFINTGGWGYEHSAISATEAAKEAAANVREAPPEQIEAAAAAAKEAATEAWRTAEFVIFGVKAEVIQAAKEAAAAAAKEAAAYAA